MELLLHDLITICPNYRYLENNARCFSQCCEYSGQLPQYLYHRPSSLVDRCSQRLLSASEEQAQYIHVKDVKKG